MLDFLISLFDTHGFPPRWKCGVWSDSLGWLHISSDLAIFGAYVAIPCVLAFFTLRRKDIPFPRVLWLFVAFIFACGTTHLIDAIIFWNPVYRFAGVVKLITALASWGTVIALVRIVPQVLHFPGLVKLNEALRDEIEDRKRIEAQLRQSEADQRIARESQQRLAAERDELLRRLQLQIKSMPMAYIQYDSHLRVIDWNPAAERIFGYSKDEVLGLGPPFENIVPAAEQERVQRALDRLRAGETTTYSVNQNLTKDGQIITCEWSNTRLETEDGQFGGLVSLAQDATERISLEEQLRQTLKMEAIGKLAGGVAHDFNNLLTVILGYIAILKEGPGEDDLFQEAVEQVHYAANQAAGLTRQLLAFGRKQMLTPVTLDLNSLLIDMQKMLGRIIREDVDLRFQLADDLWVVRVDVGQMEQVLMNLVVNSSDAMPLGGTLVIETSNVELDAHYAAKQSGARAGQHVLLAVIDTGTGMDRLTLQRIFEPFFTTKGDEGTGLGLATVYGIVKQSGGHVVAESEPSRGTTFKIYLPRDPDAHNTIQSIATHRPCVNGTETVLLVEDEEGVRSLARTVLTQQGYRVLEACNGIDALLICEEYKDVINLVATDIVMPQMGGRDLVDRLQVLRPHIKVLFVSGYTDDAIMRQDFLNAEVAFLQKPYTPDMITQAVRAALDSPKQNGITTYRADQKDKSSPHILDGEARLRR